MELTRLQTSHVDVANMPLERLAASKQVPESQKLAAVSQAFEAVLLRQILQESQKPAFPSKFVGNTATDGIYRDLVVNQLAENISKSGSLGLAKNLASEMQRQTAAQSPREVRAVEGSGKAGPCVTSLTRATKHE